MLLCCPPSSWWMQHLPAKYWHGRITLVCLCFFLVLAWRVWATCKNTSSRWTRKTQANSLIAVSLFPVLPLFFALFLKFSSLSLSSNILHMLGIWSYSRHPNYFGEVCALLFPLSLCSLSLMTTGFYPGELTLFHQKNLQMLLWWGLYVICVPTLRGPQHLACLSPIFLTYLLCFVSGIPILERSAEKKWGEFFFFILLVCLAAPLG